MQVRARAIASRSCARLNKAKQVIERLDQLILWRQGGGAALGLVSDVKEGFHQILSQCAGIGE